MSAVKLASGYIELTVKAAGKGMQEITTQVTGIEKAAKKSGEIAGEAIERGVSEGAKKAGKTVQTEINDAATRAGKDAGKSAGDAINDGISRGAKKSKSALRELGNDILDAVRQGAEDAGTSLDEIITDAAGRAGGKIGDIIGNSRIGHAIRDAADQMGGLVEGLQPAVDSFDHIRDAILGIKQGDAAGALNDVAGALNSIGQTGAANTIQDLANKAEPLQATFKNLKGDIQDTTGGLLTLAGNSGKISGGLSAIASAAGPLAATLAGLDQFMPGFHGAWTGVRDQITGKKDFNLNDWLHTAVPSLGIVDSVLGRDLPGAKPQAPALPPMTQADKDNLNRMLLPPGLAAGGVTPAGRIFGPGTGTSDSILGVNADGMATALVSNGEGVVRKSAMDAGAGPLVAALNGGADPAQVLRGILPGFDDGGVVPPAPEIKVPEATKGAAGTFNTWLQAQQGKAYQYGTLYDCSGFMSQVYNQLTGKQMPRFNTESDLAAYGFVRGSKPGTFQLGIHHGGGGPNSHMAGTLPDGRNVESGGNGVQIGAGAHGALDPQFEDHWYLPGSEAPQSPMGPALTGAGVSPLTGSPAMPPGVERTEGYIPAGAGGKGQAGTSFASGLLGMGAEAINGFIDQAAAAASAAVAAGIAGGTFGAGAGGGSQAGAAAAQAAISMGTAAAKRGIEYGFQMGGIGIDAAAEILMPFGVPRLFNTDPTQFMPQLPGMPTAVTTGEKADLQQTDPAAGQGLQPGAPVQPGQMAGQSPVGAPAPKASPGGVAPAAPPAPVASWWSGGPPRQPGAPVAPAGGRVPTPMDFIPPPGQPNMGSSAPALDQILAGLTVGVYDDGGWLPPGGVAINKSKSVEPMPVFSDPQWGTLKAIANHDVAAPDPSTYGGGGDYSVRIENLTVKDVEEMSREIESKQRLQTMRYRGRP